jgi:pyruvate/2-oxoglutarate/acetoin dehydrogenase E1 component
MRIISFSEATLEAMREEMRLDDRVFLMGEDIAKQGGVFGQFKGLAQEFGFERVRDTPISETAIVGAGVGAALAGTVPVVDMHFADFVGVAMDEVMNQMAKIRYMFGGQGKMPFVLRAPDGATRSAAAQHSQSLEALFLHIPGLKVVVPSNPTDAKGLLKAAIRDQNPVIYFEHKDLYKMKGPVPDGEVLTPIGKAAVVRQGKDVTIVSYSAMFNKCLKAADILAEKHGIESEVIDLRSIVPLDLETIYESVKKTHHLVVAHEAVKTGGVGAEIVSSVTENIIEYIDGPIMRVGAAYTPIPFSPVLQDTVLPNEQNVVEATLATQW